MVCRDVPSAPCSLPPHTPFPPILPSAPCILPSAPYSLPPHTPSPSAPYSRPPQPPFRPMLPSAPAFLPPQPPVRPMLRVPSTPASLPIVGVRGCLSADAEPECDGAALASCSASMCECAARMCGGSLAGSSAAELCAHGHGCAARSARTFTLAPNERSRARTMADTPLARRLRDEAGSPCLRTVIKLFLESILQPPAP
jgi:hypothetical protein